MNKVILLARLTHNPEIRYTNSAEPLAIANFTLAVNKRFKKEGEPEADFINCIAFGKTAIFAEKYFSKGQQISVIGRLQTRSWEDKETGQKRYATEVVIEEQFFADTKKDNNVTKNTKPESFDTISEETDDDLPF